MNVLVTWDLLCHLGIYIVPTWGYTGIRGQSDGWKNGDNWSHENDWEQ